MTMNPRALLALAGVVLASMTVTAHPLAYPNPPSTHTFPAPTIWYVDFAAGHLVPDSSGNAFLSILDTLWVPVAGFACQDRNGDNLCGGSVGELAQPFCATTVITDLTNGGLWDPSFDVFVYEDNTLAICNTFGFWFTGVVSH